MNVILNIENFTLRMTWKIQFKKPILKIKLPKFKK